MTRPSLMQVTTMLSHVEEVGKAPLPDQAELDSLRSNAAKQQQKVDQLTTPEPSANGAEVPQPQLPAIFINDTHAPLRRPCAAGTVTKPASCIGVFSQSHVMCKSPQGACTCLCF